MAWGKRNGKQRFKCKSCGMMFTRDNPEVALANQFIWFEKWISERQVYKYLVRDSGLSQSTIQRLFRHYLKQAPEVVIRSKVQAHLLIDATYFPNDLCLVLYYDHDIRYTQLYRMTDGERYEQMREDLENLKVLGVDVASITCDGHKALLKAIRKAYPDTLIQRCLVHIKRQSGTWLTPYPKTVAAQELLRLSRRITGLKTYEQSNQWLIDLHNWHKEYKAYVNEKAVNLSTGRYWYKHKMLHQTASMIIKAIPHMFHYLDHPQIPYTTNLLESFFGHLKEKLEIHRGLRPQAKRNFIKWYLHFKNNGK
jgi:Transposase, Mutator family